VKRRLPAVVIAALVFAMVLSSQAFAARGPDQGGPVNAQLFAKASNGYSAQLSSEGDKIRLTLSRGFLTGLIYTFRGHVSADGIEAKIAGLGNIDLHFVAAGKTKRRRPPRNCNGRLAQLTEGHFIGSFRFRAEQGAARIDVAHAKGSTAIPGWHCPHQSFKDFLESRPEGFTVTSLRAEDTKRQVGLLAFAGTDAEHPDPEGAEVSAAMVSRRGPVKVDHVAVVLSRSIFSFDSALTSATVAPPSPFHGSATYCTTCAPGSRWTGDLRVSLPGVREEVSLVGPAFETTLKSVQASGSEEGSAMSRSSLATRIPGGDYPQVPRKGPLGQRLNARR
jgi:hypothetical protein